MSAFIGILDDIRWCIGGNNSIFEGGKTISKPDLKFEGPTRPLKVVQRGKVKLSIKVSERNNSRDKKVK